MGLWGYEGRGRGLLGNALQPAGDLSRRSRKAKPEADGQRQAAQRPAKARAGGWAELRTHAVGVLASSPT